MSTLPSLNVFEAGFYTFIVGALVFIVALAWNAAVEALINHWVKMKNKVGYKFLYAFILTIISIIFIYYMAKFLHQKVRFSSSTSPP